jgi:predicted metal-dependent phosphoesterase TrpH
MLKLQVEFHCHTCFSEDSLTSPRLLVETCRRKGIDRVVVTDHNTISGALRARDIDPQRVIIGEEIMTTRGEILASFVQEEIPARLEPLETIARLKDQGAFISVSHPFDVFRSGHWELDDLLSILPHIDAVETYNARVMWPAHNRQALAFARAHDLAGTAGSDAHAAFELGQANLLLDPFEDAEGLRRAIRSAQPKVRWSPPWVHLTSRYAVVQKRRGNFPPGCRD